MPDPIGLRKNIFSLAKAEMEDDNNYNNNSDKNNNNNNNNVH